MSRVRHAKRAGSWYDSNAEELSRFIESQFDTAEKRIAEEAAVAGGAPVATPSKLFGIIGPHAGLSYCAATSACAYARLREYLYRPTDGGKVVGDGVARIFLMGPSHAKYFPGVAFPSSTSYETPFGPLAVDTAMQKQVEQSCAKHGCPSGWMTPQEDEAEHSLELHTPFISHILRRPPGRAKPLHHVSIVPIVVGDMDSTTEAKFGAALRPFLPVTTQTTDSNSPSNSASNLFVLSTDFCHWGERFRYTYRFDQKVPLADSIESMDREAMRLLANNDLRGWRSYMDTTANTICGRHVLASFMHAAANPSTGEPDIRARFLHYSQSNRAASPRDSSVSYASAILSDM